MNRFICTTAAFLCYCFLFAQTKPVDLSTISDKSSMAEFYNLMKAKDKSYYAAWKYVSLDSAIWNGLKMKDIFVYEDNMEMNVDKSVDYATQKLINYIESTYKYDVTKETRYSSTIYEVNTSNFRLELDVDVYEDDSIKKNTPSELKITYKTQYNQPYAKIENNVPKSPDGKFYYIKFQSSNVCANFQLNGIDVNSHCGERRYINKEQINLNPYILNNKMSQIKITIKPGYDENNVQTPTIIKDSYFSATLCEGILKQGILECLKETPICNYMDYVTDTIINDDGDKRYYSYMGNPNYGTKTLSCNLDFNPDVSYTIQGWENGKDLRKDPNIKQKIIALYEKLGMIIKTKDEKALNDFMYQKGYEKSVSSYNSSSDSRDTWEEWMKMFEYAYNFNVEQDFQLEFSEDGKLVYASPNRQMDMLRVIGKQKAEGFTFFMYEDKNTNELKAIR